MRHRVRFGAVEWMACALLFVLGNGAVFAQSAETRAATGSISGIVTKDGAPAAGVGVLLVERNARGWGAGDTVSRTRSDKEGRFAFDGLARGSYGLDAFQPGAFIHDSTPWDGPVQITVGDGESVTGVKLELERGGVITGKLVNEEGRPVAGEAIHLYIEKPGEGGATTMTSVEGYRETDDRGIYRIYGLSPGRYAVGAGALKNESGYGFGSRTSYDLAFHGGSATPEGAKLIAVESGTEARGADIVVKRGVSGFAIAGKVLDAETRKPVTNVWLGRGPMKDGKLTGYAGGGGVRDDGSFVMEGVLPGTYGVIANVTDAEAGSYYCDPVEVTVTDRDIKEVIVEMRRGASISGVFMPLETDRGLDLSTIRNSSVILQPVVAPGDASTMDALSFGNLRVKADLTFTSSGLRLGAYRALFSQYSPVKGFYVARVEVEGSPLNGPIRISELKQLANVTIVVGRTTSVFRGRVVLRNGAMPFDRIGVQLRTPDAAAPVAYMRVDATGAFLMESAPPGEYQAIAFARTGGETIVESKPVSVTIGREGTVEVKIELDLGPKPPESGGDQ